MAVLEKDLYDETKSLTDIIVPEEWLLPYEVGELFGVGPRTVNRWHEKFANVRKFKTPGGHLRYYKPDVLLILEQHANNDNPAGK